jgi:hypothetical protein
MKTHRIAVLALAAGLLLAAHPLSAQSENQSDISGGTVTTSGVAGGVGLPAAPSLEGWIIRTEVLNLVGVLRAGELRLPDGTLVSTPVQTALAQLLSGQGTLAALVLVGGGCGPCGAPLADALAALGVDPTAATLNGAIDAFNAVVAEADLPTLQGETVRAIHALLLAVIQALPATGG